MKNPSPKTAARALGFAIAAAAILCISIGVSSESTTNPPDRDIEVYIRFHDQKTYYVGDPIIVEFQITNSGEKPYLFIASFDTVFTFDFEVASVSNRKVEHSIRYAIERTKYAPVLNDKITLKPFEVYGARIDIAEWFDLKEPGEYMIRGAFFPRLVTDPAERVLSVNELYLSLNPAYTETFKEKKREDEIVRLKAEKLPPYEVVEFLIRSLMEKDFDKYFIYINFDQFIRQFENAKRKYLGARDIDRPKVIEEFKRYLRGENTLEGIPFSETIPIDYEILKTVIEGRDAQVTVVQTFRYLRYLEKKRYTYFLRQYGDTWRLERYQIVNVGF